MKIVTYKCKDFIKSIPASTVDLTPRKGDILLFESILYMVTDVVTCHCNNKNIDVYLEKYKSPASI